MIEEDFGKRLYELRKVKNVSARDMSLSVGQNAGYINRIENGKAMPSMSIFFFICDYLGVTPSEFFATQVSNPQRLRQCIKQLETLNSSKFENIAAVINDLATK